MRFAQFLEQYRKNLTDAVTLEELLQEAKQNHRVQKLLPVYVMKDRNTFNHLLRLADKDPYARKIAAHARMTVETLAKSKKKSVKMKRLLGHLADITDVSMQTNSITMEDWEFDGYSRVINSYFVTNKVFTPFKALRHRQKMDSVDWENLIGPNN
ncbi:MAG: hypothetical protein CVU89_04530 [Firmicutes bacterium HGW-Firmicutes-14]|jgi:hypothetical protein|nr:MAG: hypothetical protein CVU89_04530 [Firmicutes bacterium HGW-Firmicutes-14]